MKFKPKVVLAKKETTYGTDIVPVAAANAIEIVGAEIDPIVADEVTHDVDRSGLGNVISALVGKHVVVRFKVALSPSGAAGTAPAWGVLMELCAMSETIVTATSVTYAPVDSTEPSGSLYFHTTQAKHALLGARGNWSIDLASKAYPYIQFEFTGLLVAPVAASIPAATLSAFKAPQAVSNANSAFSLHGISAIMRSMNFSPNNEVKYNNLVGSESVTIADRAAGGSVVIDAPALATKDWYAAVQAGTLGVLSFTHGKTAGAIAEIRGDLTQLSTIANQDNDGELGHSFTTRMIPSSAGADDCKVILT